MNKTNIDWPGLTHSWNPIYGCLRGIVGADSRKNGIAPKKEWIESIQNPNIHFKKNIQRHL